MPKIIGEYLDRLSTIEMRPGKGNLPRGVIHKLYNAARKPNDNPLTFQMSDNLLKEIKKGDTVFFVTGAGGPPALPNGEVDGILGTIALAKTLHYGVGITPIILSEEHIKASIQATSRAAGLNFREVTDMNMEHVITYIPMPINHKDCFEQAEYIVEEFNPSAVIFIEKLAPNFKNVIHGTTGLNYDDVHTKPQYLFEAAQKRSIITAGIGDGGNEVGFGLISEAVKNIMPNGTICQCDCGGGMTSNISTDFLMVSSISNWGAYSVSAMIAYLLERQDILTTQIELENMLKACVNSGALDGVLGVPKYADDGVPLDTQISFIAMINSVIEIGLSNLKSPGH